MWGRGVLNDRTAIDWLDYRQVVQTGLGARLRKRQCVCTAEVLIKLSVLLVGGYGAAPVAPLLPALKLCFVVLPGLHADAVSAATAGVASAAASSLTGSVQPASGHLRARSFCPLWQELAAARARELGYRKSVSTGGRGRSAGGRGRGAQHMGRRGRGENGCVRLRLRTDTCASACQRWTHSRCRADAFGAARCSEGQLGRRRLQCSAAGAVQGRGALERQVRRRARLVVVTRCWARAPGGGRGRARCAANRAARRGAMHSTGGARAALANTRRHD